MLIAALIGAVVVIGATFLPWIGDPASDRTATGWEVYDNQTDAPNSGLYFDELTAQDAPFFTGLSSIIAGAAAGALALVLIAARSSNSASARGLLAFLAIVAGVLVLVVAGTNAAAFIRKDDRAPIDLEWGLIVVWAGAVLSAAIIPAAMQVAGRGGGGGGSTSSSSPVV